MSHPSDLVTAPGEKSEPGARPAMGTWPGRREIIALGVVLLVGFLLRLAYLRETAALPFFGAPVGDSAAHLNRAAEIARGVILPSHPLYYCSILNPYFLAVALAVLHGSLFGVCVIQLIAGIAVVALLAFQARALYGRAAGLATAVLGAFYGPFAFFEADILGVVWGQLALAAGILACIGWARDAQRAQAQAARLGVAGLAFGLATVERANLLVLAPVAAAWCAAHVGRRRAIRALAAFAGGVALPLALTLTLNLAGSGQWVLLTTSFGINLSLGYHEGAPGTFEEPWERDAPEFAAQHTEPEEASIAMASRQLGHPVTPQESSRYWTGRALQFIRERPGEAATITIHKVGLLLNAAEMPNHLDYAFMRECAPALRWMPVGFAWVLPLAVIGVGDAVRRRNRRRESLLLAAIAAAAMLSVVPFTVADRYRAPMLVPLLIAAGGGAAALVRIASAREERAQRGTLALLTAALCAVAVTAIPLVRPLAGRNYWLFAQAYERRGNMRAAVAAYDAAVRAEPENASLLNNLGAACRSLGDRARAEDAFRRAARVDPRLALPHKNLGMLLIREGRMEEAMGELEAATRLDPGDAETVGAIAALLAERGDETGSKAAFARARALAPTDSRLLGLIEHYEGPSGAESGKKRPPE